MLKKLLSLSLIVLISCGGGGGGGGDTTEPVDPAPVAIFSGSPVSGPTPLQVNFTSGSTNATTHAWDFENDGSVKVSTLNKDIFSENVLVAAGPWSSNFSSWFGFEIPIKPLKGQILRLKSDQIIENGFHWGPNYVTTKQDGLIWAGTTEEDVGFDENPSNFGLISIMESLVTVFPFLENSELVLQTACLRPLAVDKSPVLS